MRTPTSNETYRRVDIGSTRIDNVVLDGVEAGGLLALEDASRNEEVRAVADARDRLALGEDRGGKARVLGIAAPIVRGVSTRHDQRVKVLGADVIDLLVALVGVAGGGEKKKTSRSGWLFARLSHLSEKAFALSGEPSG